MMAFLGLIIFVAVLKMSPTDIKELVWKTISKFETLSMLGWALAGVNMVVTIAIVQIYRKKRK